MNIPAPYKSTPVFTETSLPAGIRNAHSTKAGTWGILQILSGAATYVIEAHESQSERRRIMKSGDIQIIESELLHHVEPDSAMEMQVHFYDHRPDVDEAGMI